MSAARSFGDALLYPSVLRRSRGAEGPAAKWVNCPYFRQERSSIIITQKEEYSFPINE
jgi:hypothetical protein